MVITDGSVPYLKLEGWAGAGSSGLMEIWVGCGGRVECSGCFVGAGLGIEWGWQGEEAYRVG